MQILTRNSSRKMDAIKKVVELMEDNGIPVMALRGALEVDVKEWGRSIEGTPVTEGPFTEITLTVLVPRHD